MPRPDGAARETRVPLTRARILDAAVLLCDAGGIEALTMRQLGGALGVEAMSLYNHVEGKNDILVGILDVVLSEIELAPIAPDWRSATRDSALSAHDVLVEHPWTSGLLLSRDAVRISSARMRWIESVLARLRAAGFSPAAASRGYHAIDSHVLGFTLWELGHSAPPSAPPDYLARILSTLDFTDYPFLEEHARVHLEGHGGHEPTEFEFGLELILDGLGRIRAAG